MRDARALKCPCNARSRRARAARTQIRLARAVPRRHPPPASLELSEAELRALAAHSLDRVQAFLRALPDAPMHRLDGARKLVRALREPMPEAGRSAPALLTQLFQRVLPVALNTASAGYLAYIPGGGLPQSALAEFIAAATNRYVGIWQAAPGLVQLETNVIRWFCEMAGLPAASGGLLTSGGSMATLTALVAARLERLPVEFFNGVLYTSAHAHHSVHKAARIAGFPEGCLREIPVDARFRMDPDALRQAIARDRAAGRTPFFVVASAGTTATGAVDPLPEIAAICAENHLWLHVDAAYGGFFLLTERGRAALQGIDRADSITLDPHKGLFLPYGTGCLLVRELESLRRAYGGRGSYMPAAEQDPDRWDFAELGFELSREARGLQVWLPLKLHGAGAFRAALDEKLELARWAAEALAGIPGIAVLNAPELSLFAFRATPPAGEDRDVFNRRLMHRVNARQRVLLTGVQLADGFALRVCVLSFRTHADRVAMAIDDVRAAMNDLIGISAQTTARPTTRDDT